MDPVEGICKVTNIGIYDGLYFKGRHYAGYNFKDEDGIECYDAWNQKLLVRIFCVTLDGTGGIASYVAGRCPQQFDGPGCYFSGDQTYLPQSLQFQSATDWVSPLDPRFSLARHYRSDASFLNATTGTSNVNARGILSHGGAWRSEYDYFIRDSGGNSLKTPDGKNIPLPALNATNATVAGYPYTIKEQSGYGSPWILSDGTGKKMTFVRVPTRAMLALRKIEWPDGYVINITRASNSAISSIYDNRGQRAQVTTSTTAVPNNTTNAFVTRIEIDADYDGATFDPELALSYTYSPNPAASAYPVLDAVNREDLVTSAVSTIAEYDYTPLSQQFPPALTAIYDGRLDSSGQPFPVAEFEYVALTEGKVLGTKGGGGSGSYAFSSALTGPGLATFEATAINPLGLATSYSFDRLNGIRMLTRVEGEETATCLGTTREIGYTPNSGAPTGFIYETVDANGSLTIFERNSRGLVTTMTEDAGGPAPRVTSYTWHSTLRLPLTRVTSALEETFVYGATGLLTSYTQTDVLSGSPTNGQTRTWSFTYTTLASGLTVLTAVDGPGLAADGVNDVTSYTHDTFGRLTSITDPNGLVTTVLNYSEHGQPTLVRLPDDTEWHYSYDYLGRLLTSGFGPAGATPVITSFSYDAVGQVVALTDFRNQVWTFEYDESKRLTKTIAPSGHVALLMYDQMGNPVRTEYSVGANPPNFWFDALYDELGRVRRSVGALGQSWNFGYDREDNLVTEEDPFSYITTNGFDALNRLVSVVDRAGHLTTLEYNDADQMATYSDPRQIVTTYEYNGFGEIVTETSQDSGLTEFVRDRRGLVTSRTDARGTTTTYSYDNGGRLLSVDYPAGNAGDQAFVYDVSYLAAPPNTNKGYVGRIVDGLIQTDFLHETTSMGTRLTTQAVYPAGRTYFTIEEYDHEGEQQRVTYPSGKEIHLDRDQDGRIERIRLFAGSTWTTLVDAVSYLPNGPIEQMTFGDGSSQTRTYDASYRLIAVRDENGFTTLRHLTYGYDNRDDITAITNLAIPALQDSFGYSPRQELASATGDYGTLTYSYDAVGNRLSTGLDQGSGLVTETYSYPTSSNRLEGVASSGGTGRGLTYDAAGNVVEDAGPSKLYGYTYDAAGRMEALSLNGVEKAQYRYDWAGRQAIRMLADTGTTLHVTFDSAGNRLAEYDQATGSPLREYVWFEGQPIAVLEAGQVYLVRTDHIGRPSFATDQSGTVVWTVDYLPFGEVFVSTGTPINLRFPGQWFQAESSLHQNWMRDYDPTTGRYIQPDPLGLMDGSSIYGYARQNPGRWVDPTGEQVAGAMSDVPGYAATAQTEAGQFGLGRIIGFCVSKLALPLAILWPSSLADPSLDECWQCNVVSTTPYGGKTPDDIPGEFRPFGSGGAKKGPDGAIWEKDYSGHGGSKWKRWPNGKSWERNEGRESVRPDGSVR